MSRIGPAFEGARSAGRAAFVAYLTAGDPEPSATVPLVRALERAGADVVELGVPYSDPLADGPINQRAAARALAAGTTLAGVLELSEAVRRGSEIPLVLFSYFNPIHRMGCAEFARRAASAGVDGVLVTDLPVEEAGDYTRAMRTADVDTVYLVAPTSSPGRVDAISRECRGFLYYISRTGVTGDPNDLSSTLGAEVEGVRCRTDLPIAVGFGISTPEQVRCVAQVADGVVVGSALVDRIATHAAEADLPRRLESFAARLVAASRKTVGPARGPEGGLEAG